MAKASIIPVSELRQLVRADFDAGRLFWAYRSREMFATHRAFAAWNAAWAEKEAFLTDHGGGYLMGRIHKRKYLAHRVMWALSAGSWPAGDIDHINGDPSDNRMANLRHVSHAANQRNQRLRATNTSGENGVGWDARRNLWRASITVDGRTHFLGRFATMDDAVAARKAADRAYGFHENHGR